MFLLVIGSVLYFVGSSEGPTGVIVKGVIGTLWYLVLSIIANICFGYIGLPLVTVLFISSFLVWLIQSCARNDGMTEPIIRIDGSFRDRRQSFFQQLNTNVLEQSLGIIITEHNDTIESDQEKEEQQDGPDVMAMDESCKAVDVDSLPFITVSESEDGEDNLRKRHGGVQFAKTQSMDLEDKQLPLHFYGSDSPPVRGILKKTDNTSELLTVTHIFLVLITTCLLVFLWHNLWLFMVILPIIVWLVIRKYVLNQFPTMSAGYKKCRKLLKYLFATKKNVLCPRPIPILLQLCQSLDRNLLCIIKSSVSPIISGAIILALIIGGIGGCVFFILQVQVELAYSVNMMKQVLNTSVTQSPWIHK